MSLTANAIRIHNMGKHYRGTIAVEDLSLAVPEGCMFGFLGPNGSGKSTTIGCLTGLLEPTAGSIEILGQRMTVNNAALKRRVGVMPETLGLFDPLYAQEFLAFVARMYSVSEDDTRRRVTELLEALDLTDVRKMIGEYSTGMRKRLAFAAAVIHSPAVLFLDEPFESIDPAGVAAMKKWLRRFTEHGRTVFITSHVLDTVERLCDRVAIVTKPGKLVWEGDLTVLHAGGELRHGSKAYRSLEALFLNLTGENHADLAWL
jgi:ABC-2 type transport system ATP-binding protein